jgi:hypothetical protein
MEHAPSELRATVLIVDVCPMRGMLLLTFSGTCTCKVIGRSSIHEVIIGTVAAVIRSMGQVRRGRD